MLFSPPLPTSVGSKSKLSKQTQPAQPVTAGNDDFDQLLASIHTKISQDFGTSTAQNDHACPSSLSPIAPASASSAISIPVNGGTPPKETIRSKEERRKIREMRKSLKVVPYEVWEIFNSMQTRFESLKLSEEVEGRVAESSKPSSSQSATKVVENTSESESVKLPFKKRVYKGEKVPSPKTTDNGTKALGKAEGSKEKNGASAKPSKTKESPAPTAQTSTEQSPLHSPEKIPPLKLKVSRSSSGKVETACSSTSPHYSPTPSPVKHTKSSKVSKTNLPPPKANEIHVVEPKSLPKRIQPKHILPLLAPKTPVVLANSFSSQPGLVPIAPKPISKEPLSLSESLKLIIPPPPVETAPVPNSFSGKKRGRPKKRLLDAEEVPESAVGAFPESQLKKIKSVEETPVKRVSDVPREVRKQIKELETKFNMQESIYEPSSLGAKSKKEDREEDLEICDCKIIPGVVQCGYGCSSRSSYFECDPKECPCGNQCTNNAIQQKRWTNGLELFPTEKKGFGVRCTVPIRRGALICEYVGEVVSWEVFRERMEKEYNHNLHHYCLKLDSNKVIDAYSQGGIGRFINHSCEPNSQTQKWVVQGQDRMAIFATEDIPAGKEITYDYKFESFDVQQPCFCGSKHCRGFTGVQKSQKLNGLLMKKRPSSSTSTTATNGPSRSSSISSQPKPVETPRPKSPTKETCIPLPPLNGLPVSPRKKSPAKEIPPTVSPLSPNKKKPSTNGWLFTDPPVMKSIGFPSKKTAVILNGDASPKKTENKSIISPRQKMSPTKIPSISPPKHTPEITAVVSETPKLIVSPPKRPGATVNGPTDRTEEVVTSVPKETSPVAKKRRKTGSALDAVLLNPSVKNEQSPSPTHGKRSPLLLERGRTKKLKIESGLLNGPSSIASPDEKVSTVETTTTTVEEEQIFLPRNMRKVLKEGKREERAKWSIPYTPIELPSLACEALKGVRGSSKYVPKKEKKNEKRDSSEQLYPPSYFRPVQWEPSAEDIIRCFEEEVIRCSCGIYLEDGRMTECEQCQTWQHNECVGVPPSNDKQSYKCPRCLNVKTPLEIHQNLPSQMNPDSLDCYTTLMAPNCQNFPVRVGDCVYLTKDRAPVDPNGLYDPLTLDIVRVDKMWIEGTTGNKKLYGNHYLRPHETYHEATRNFYENELLKSPIPETVALEAVLGRCCIMDPITFAKGKPKEYPVEHCFICELKTNKKAASFHRLKSAEKSPINTKKYYFERYPEKLKLRRTLKPHGILVTKKKQKADAARKKTDQPNAIVSVVREKCERIQTVMDRLSEKAVVAQNTSLNSSSSASWPP